MDIGREDLTTITKWLKAIDHEEDSLENGSYININVQRLQ